VQRPLVKQRRFEECIRKGVKQNLKCKADKQKGLTYASGISGPTVGKGTVVQGPKTAKKGPIFCPHCKKKKGHKTTTRSAKCSFSTNKKSKFYKAGNYYVHIVEGEFGTCLCCDT
jgi:ribosomal protein L37E